MLDSHSLPIDDPFINPTKWHNVISISDTKIQEYRASLVIHLSLDGSWYKGKQGKFIYGPKFVPLRKSIVKRQLEIKNQINELVVFGGGTDTNSFSLAIANALANKSHFNLVSFFSSNADYICGLDVRFQVFPFGLKLDYYLSRADVVITTASMSSLGILAREIPCGVACATENQLEYYSALKNRM